MNTIDYRGFTIPNVVTTKFPTLEDMEIRAQDLISILQKELKLRDHPAGGASSDLYWFLNVVQGLQQQSYQRFLENCALNKNN